MLSAFDVFESDKDHENLIDSLQRILEKSKQMGVQLQSVATFHNNTVQGWPRSAPLHHQQQQLYQ